MKYPLYLVPYPKEITVSKDENENCEYFEIGLRVYCEKAFHNAGVTFFDYSKKLFDIEACAVDNKDCADVVITADASLKSDEYTLCSAGKRAVLKASDAGGAVKAVVTLIQLMKKLDGKLYCCEAEIRDMPTVSYSAIMVDLARVWHDFDWLLKYVDLCCFYKVKTLHLHFTDDQSYTLPSELFPKLSTEGRHYSFEQIKILREYAKQRGVELMPEIDVPGHCTAFQENYSDIFGTGGIICQTFESIKAMKELFGELCDMFPESRNIHIGGDEAAIQKWLEVDNDYYRSLGIDVKAEDEKYTSERLLANFVNEMANAVFEKGKQPIAWEGFAKCVNQYVRKDLIMVSWENYYQTAPDLLDGGYKIINCSWEPLYICTPRKYWQLKNVFEWNMYTWIPVHWSSPYYKSKLEIDEDDRVLGGGLCAWSDNIKRFYQNEIPDGVKEEFRLSAERLPAMSERLWHPGKTPVREFSEFLKSHVHLQKSIEKICE
ncbi:MAG: hypothetical protein E7646_08895 [Ruminococcaceae bacterium]|nr:hypothetical protein [Oscillospiraceae bacterium]